MVALDNKWDNKHGVSCC